MHNVILFTVKPSSLSSTPCLWRSPSSGRFSVKSLPAVKQCGQIWRNQNVHVNLECTPDSCVSRCGRPTKIAFPLGWCTAELPGKEEAGWWTRRRWRFSLFRLHHSHSKTLCFSSAAKPVGGLMKPSSKLSPNRLVIHCVLSGCRPTVEKQLTVTPVKVHVGSALIPQSGCRRTRCERASPGRTGRISSHSVETRNRLTSVEKRSEKLTKKSSVYSVVVSEKNEPPTHPSVPPCVLTGFS